MREHGITRAGYNVSGDLEFITIYTLFDITRTGVLKIYDSRIPAFIDDADQLVRNQTEWNRSRNQQRNWETLVQLISLRAQPVMLENPKRLLAADTISLGLGHHWPIPQTVWTVSFATEHTRVYSDGADDLGQLKRECQLVPMLTGLNETVTFERACIETTGDYANTSFAVTRRLANQYVTP